MRNGAENLLVAIVLSAFLLCIYLGIDLPA